MKIADRTAEGIPAPKVVHLGAQFAPFGAQQAVLRPGPVHPQNDARHLAQPTQGLDDVLGGPNRAVVEVPHI